MRYLLRDSIQLRGHRKLPYAFYDERNGNTRFLTRSQFQLLLQFTGKNDIDINALSEDEQIFINKLLKSDIITENTSGVTRDLQYKYYDNMYKRSVQWSITGKCNYRCRHCFLSAPENIAPDLTHEQCMDIIRQLDECGVKNVSLTGGEALTRSDFLDLIDEMLRRKMIITNIYTNGLLVSQKLLDAFKARGIRPSFNVSFDGLGWHDWMRGVQGAEKVAFNCFRLLRENGYPFSCAMCLFRENIGTIRETVRVLAAEGCTALKLQLSTPQGEWLNEKEHFLTYDEVFNRYLEYLPQYWEDGCPLTIQMEGFFCYSTGAGYYFVPTDHTDYGKDPSNRTLCAVIHNELYISSEGRVLPCMGMAGMKIEKDFPSILNMPLSQILTDSYYSRLLEKRVGHLLDKNPECRDCPHKCACCGGCRTYALIDHPTDYFAPDPITCKLFREGWIEKIDAVAGKFWKKYVPFAADTDTDSCGNDMLPC